MFNSHGSGSVTLLLAVLTVGIASAQVPNSRAAELAAERDAKVAKAQSITLTKPERIYYSILKNPFVKGFLGGGNGVSVRFGGLYPGSGFAAGLNYTRKGMLEDKVDFTAYVTGSIRQYYQAGMLLSMPHIATDRIQLDYFLRRNYAPQLSYYGPGNASLDSNRTNFLREDVSNTFRAGFKPFHRHVFIGAIGGVEWINIGSGTSGASPSTETRFTPAETPGIDRQANYFEIGPFITLDYTDNLNNPHSGGKYEVRHLWFHDWKFDQYSFRKMQVSAEQYIPFLNKKRVIAMRAKSEWNYGDQVPFYLQASIGGPNDMRGYRQFRFYDNNMLIFNGEYRYEVKTNFDIAVFTDWGKVFHKPGQMNLSDLHGSGGFGFRWRSAGPNTVRFDIGFGPGGVNFWFSFNDIFQGLLHNLLF